MRYQLMLWTVTLLVVGCAHPSTRPSDVTGPQVWGGADNVTRFEQMYFSEQPDEQALRAAMAHGVSTVISLRGPQEHDWDERGVAERLGLNYLSIPISKKSESLDVASIHAINAAVDRLEAGSVLLHCSSGNRAAAWLATYLAEQRGLSPTDAISIAREAGLTMPAMEQRVHTYLKGPSTSASD